MFICFLCLLALTFFKIKSLRLFARKFNGENSASSHQNPNLSNPANPCMPTEILVEILSRVSVKSLLKFRCVSKSWLALISSPEFINSHLSLSASNSNNIQESNLDYLMKNLEVSFLFEGSVNGLICLVNRAKKIYIWNPTIRKYKKLRDYKFESWHFGRFVYGFGYDKLRDDYKVVLYNFHEVAIYSLKSDCWRRINHPPNGGRFINTGKFLNGKLYWASVVDDVDMERVWSITSFDLNDEKWRMVEDPPCGNDIFVLGALESNLSIMICSRTTDIDVWAMKEYENKESWTKTFTISCSIDRAEYFLAQSFYLTKRGEFFIMSRPYHMIYEPSDNSIRYLDLKTFDYDLLADFYVQTLVCP